MNKTPQANRVHIGLFGNRNAGKSSLFNAIIGQDIAVVSAVEGTTTDPVIKAMELIPFGPVVWMDTAGLDDEGILGSLRVKKTNQMLDRTDMAIYVIDGQHPDYDGFEKMTKLFKQYHIAYISVINKSDLVSSEEREKLKMVFPDALMVSAHRLEEVHHLMDCLKDQLETLEEDPPILGDLLPYGSTVVMVVPIDSEAPKGRIILPQVQLIRDCLDHGIKSYVVRDTELAETLESLNEVSLVVTDSQAFKAVSQMVSPEIPLTSFSILFARHKGNMSPLLEGVNAFKNLKKDAHILISESCTHNHSHEDIGRVKIPKLIRNHFSKDVVFSFSMGHDFPLDVTDYDLVIHCGACMVNRKTMQTRIQKCHEQGVPITNYGLTLAYFNGILDRSIEIIHKPIKTE